MPSKRLTIIVLVCALCYLEPDFTGWSVKTTLTPPKQWASTPGISPNPFSVMTEFPLQLMVKQEQAAHKRIKIRPTDAELCSKEHKLLKRAGEVSLRGTAVTEAVHRVETETRRHGTIVWVISFHRVCLLATMGLLARITIRILLQNTNAPEETTSEGQKELNLPGTCPITVIQNRAGSHTATARRKRRGAQRSKGC